MHCFPAGLSDFFLFGGIAQKKQPRPKIIVLRLFLLFLLLHSCLQNPVLMPSFFDIRQDSRLPEALIPSWLPSRSRLPYRLRSLGCLLRMCRRMWRYRCRTAGSLPYSSCILSYGILRWLPRLPGRYGCQEPSPRRAGRTVRRQLSRYRSLFLRCGCIRSRTPRICRPPIHEAPALQSLRRSSHNTVSLLFLVFYSQSHRKNQK